MSNARPHDRATEVFLNTDSALLVPVVGEAVGAEASVATSLVTCRGVVGIAVVSGATVAVGVPDSEPVKTRL